jgi:transmembrane sensor
MNQERLTYLFESYLKKSATQEERNEFFALLKDPATAKMLEQINHDYHQITFQGESLADDPTESIRQALLRIATNDKHVQYAAPVHRVHLLKTAWFRNVAAILFILGITVYIFITKGNTEKPIIVAEQNKQPGSDKAVLTLSDGRKIILDNGGKQNISDGSISIEKANGVLTYHTALTTDVAGVSYNTMNTPRGGQYQLVLPDGSKVWLNSASTIRYPTFFQGKNRMVELSGEAYFDIKQNKKLPFIVKTQKAEVLVLGTAFNINSYSDEDEFSTTLINGSIKVSSGNNNKIITPGQQAQVLKSQSDILTIKNDIDINQIIAWQKGIFKFDGVSIDVIARQLSRWYDVEVRTNINDNNFRFNGGINKKTPLKGLLKMLELNGVKNKWDDNIITLYSN